ncbi:MAG: hypothetical protein ACI8U3_001267 [Brevundimonas sp.]|uniref:hypothetical protein n=1 Tax=Brevundimonas sp. TaxID=1871086 RepID=UPI0039E60DA3
MGRDVTEVRFKRKFKDAGNRAFGFVFVTYNLPDGDVVNAQVALTNGSGEHTFPTGVSGFILACHTAGNPGGTLELTLTVGDRTLKPEFKVEFEDDTPAYIKQWRTL